MPSQKASKSSQTSGSSNSSGSRGSNASSQPQTNYGIVKDGWGSRQNFQASYGHDMSPEGIAEGNAILDAMREMDESRK